MNPLLDFHQRYLNGEIELPVYGGPGSGNHGHSGRKGKVGGSSGKGSKGLSKIQEGLTIREYAGTVGGKSHITRVEEGSIPTESISHLKGEMGEVRGAHRNRKGGEWEDFKQDIKENGIRNPIFILKDPGKQAVISEGNHRLDAALELWLKKVPVEIRYFGHSEREGLEYKE